MVRKKPDIKKTPELTVTGKKFRRSGRNGVSRLYSSVFNKLPGASILLSYPDRTVEDINEAFVRIFGYSRNEVVGKRWSELGFNNRMEDSVFQEPDKLISVRNSEIKLKTSTGEFRTFLNDVEFIEVDGKQYFLLIFHDFKDIRIPEVVKWENEQKLGLFQLALRNAPVSVAAQDKDLRYIWAYNQKSADQEEIIGHFDNDIFTPEEAALFTEIKKRVLSEGITVSKQMWLNRPSGRMFLNITWEPVRDGTGNITGVASSTVDLSAIKHAEEALRSSEERYRTLFDSMTEGFALHEIITDESGRPVDYRFLDVNHAFESLTGLKRADLLGKRVREVLPGIEEFWIENYGKVALTGEPVRLENYSSSLDRWYEVFVYRSAPGQFAVVFTDITYRKHSMEALQASEEKYRNLFENMAEEVHFWQLVHDEDGNIKTWRLVDVNPPTLKSWGVKRVEEIRGKTTDEIFGPGAAEHYMPVVRKIFSEGTSHSYEDYFPNLDKYFRFTSVPIGDHFITTGADITELRKAHEDLKESRASLERAQAVGNTGNWRLDLRKNELIWSDQNYNIFGVDRGTPLTYENFLSFLHPDDREYVDKKWKDGLAGKDYDIEHRVMANGVVKWVREKAFLEFDERGELLAGFGITQDITDRKNAEEELAQSRLKLDLALENANIGLWEWNVNTNEMTWDARTEKMFAIEHGTFENSYSSFEKLVHEEDIGHVRKAIRNTLQNGIPFETVFRTKPDKGQKRYLSCKALGNRNSNSEIISLTGVIFDITDLQTGTERLVSKLNEDLLRSNKELENFAFITSHDLQEPLRMVTSFTQLLARQYNDKLDDTAKEYISYAVDGATRMYELINSLLAYSRISRKDITFRNVDSNKIIESVKSNLILLIEERQCKITTEKLPVIFADENMINQLFQNLIINGIKFSKGAPLIHISSWSENNYHIFSVKDQGIGIESQYFERIFHIFKRLMPRDQYDGTGIGLAICKRIVENHGGRIWVESEPGKGSVFYFSVPKTDSLDFH